MGNPVRTLALSLCLAAALTCTACLDGEEALVSSASGHFAPGVTTRTQAIAALGKPSSVFESANGDKTLSWARDGGLFNPGETKQYSVEFGPDDKMIRVVSEP
jgi:hypothetical protein